MASPPPRSYFEAHHLTFEARTGQILQAARRDDQEHAPHAFDLHNQAHKKGAEALLAQALRDLQLPDHGAHRRGNAQLRKLMATLPPTMRPLRCVAAYFLGVCYAEGRGVAAR